MPGGCDGEQATRSPHDRGQRCMLARSTWLWNARSDFLVEQLPRFLGNFVENEKHETENSN